MVQTQRPKQTETSRRSAKTCQVNITEMCGTAPGLGMGLRVRFVSLRIVPPLLALFYSHFIIIFTRPKDADAGAAAEATAAAHIKNIFMQHFYDFRLVATVRHGHKESSSRGTRSDFDCHSVALLGFCFSWPIAAITVSESKTSPSPGFN